MTRLYTIFWIYSLNILCLLILSSCNSDFNSQENQYEQIELYFKQRQKKKLAKDIKKIYVITDNGCINCNKSLVNFAKNKTNDISSVFLITASGNRFDISHFDDRLPNVFYDQNFNKKAYSNIFNSSKVILLKKNDIDTILEINPPTISQQFQYLDSRN